ncbi:hypothetical protein HDK90DRAFT_506742 [Phyllosticta capitalensis]|uniref:F-box domain-containing protein n=1 Tax=Phyllosticta capitalensis TaxID=121624 RepID=A0ABR1Z3P9_9PEZI
MSSSYQQPGSVELASDEIGELAEALKLFTFQDPSQSSPLGDLPPELVLMINDHLSVVSCLSLAATCKDMQQLLRPSTERADFTSREMFLVHLETDMLSRAVEHERSGEFEDMRACTGCKKLHHRSSFSAVQLFQQPRKRLCRGSEAAFQLCKHTTMSWDSLKEPQFSRFYGCERCKYNLCNHRIRGRMLMCFVRRGVNGDSVVTSQPIVSIYEGENVLGKAVRRRLGKMRLTVCLHMVTDQTHFPGLNDMQFNGSEYDADESHRIKEHCNHIGCETEFFVKTEYDSGYVELVVERRIGLPDDPNNPLWLTQCGML